MKSYLWVLGLTAGLVLLSAGSALGQCRAGGGGKSRTANVAASGSPVVGTGQMLTGPGSWQYEVMMQQQMQQTIAQQQYMLAVQKAEKAQAKFEVRLANAQRRRAESATKLELDRAKRSTALARQ